MPDELTPDLANDAADWSRKSDAFSLTVLCGAIRIVIFLTWWVTACTRSFIERRSPERRAAKFSTLFEFHPRFFPQWLYSVASSRFQASRAFTARPIL